MKKYVVCILSVLLLAVLCGVSFARQCSDCNGTGQKACSTCAGLGYLGDRSRTCHMCNGSGTRTCSTCNGSGYVDDGGSSDGGSSDGGSSGGNTPSSTVFYEGEPIIRNIKGASADFLPVIVAKSKADVTLEDLVNTLTDAITGVIEIRTSYGFEENITGLPDGFKLTRVSSTVVRNNGLAYYSNKYSLSIPDTIKQTGKYKITITLPRIIMELLAEISILS
ncbi:MAG: hypothetical protein IJS28_05395 [Synergistaceae bacterium]|nr:hypothetical protein [Synergistaceae bacterium]